MNILSLDLALFVSLMDIYISIYGKQGPWLWLSPTAGQHTHIFPKKKKHEKPNQTIGTPTWPGHLVTLENRFASFFYIFVFIFSMVINIKSNKASQSHIGECVNFIFLFFVAFCLVSIGF